MTDQNPSPEPHDAEPGVFDSEVRAREPDANYPPLSQPLPAVGGGEVPQLNRAEQLAGEFCKSWDGSVAVGDVIAVITIASAACKLLAIIVPLFVGTAATQGWFTRKLHHASRKHFRGRSEVFHEAFARELGEFICNMPDNGVSRGEVEAMLSEMQAQWNSSNSSPTAPSQSSSPRT